MFKVKAGGHGCPTVIEQLFWKGVNMHLFIINVPITSC